MTWSWFGGENIKVVVRQTKSVAVVTVVGGVDLKTAALLTREIDSALARRGPALIIDLTGVEFLASAGLQSLAYAHAAAKGHTAVTVVADGPATHRPIALTGLDSLFGLYRTLDEALDAVPK